MGKTYRHNPLDEQYGCFEEYYRRNRLSFTSWHWYKNEIEERQAADRAWELTHWSKRRRDGRAAHYSYRPERRKIYSQITAKMIRSESRRAIHDGITGGDWDDLVFPTNWDGKKFMWSY